MAWVRLDDGVPHNPKVLKAGAQAAWLWVCSIAYAQRQLTDGIIPREAVPTLGVPNPRKLIDKLVDVGLWDVHDLGWRVHDYLEHNECRDAVLSKRSAVTAQRSEAGRRGGLRSADARKQNASNDSKQTASKAEANARSKTEAPSHPIPSHKEKEQKISAEPEADSTPAVMDFPVIGPEGPSWTLRESLIRRWQEDFPGTDVLGECRKARAWLDANPERRKTTRGIARFLVAWLTRSTDRARSGQVAIGASVGPRVNTQVSPAVAARIRLAQEAS